MPAWSAPVAAIGSGVALGVACNAPGAWPAALLALPLLSAAVIGSARGGARRSALVVAAACASWHLCAMWWVALTVRGDSASPWAWRFTVLAAVLASQVAWLLAMWLPARAIVTRFFAPGAPGVWAAAAAWALAFAAADTLRQLGWSGDGYASLGVALVDAPGVAALLPLIGAQGLGFVCVALASAAAAVALAGRPRGRVLVAGAFAVAAGAAGVAATRSDRWTTARDAPVRFVAIQPSLDKRTTWSIPQRDHAIDLLLDTINRAPRDSIVVTPETFLPESPPAARDGRWAELLDAVDRQQLHVLLGIPHQARADGERHLMNTVVHLAPGRQALYGKERLVPGGEYLPWPELLGFFYRHVFADVDQGQIPAPPELTGALFAADTELGMSICHEQAFALTMAERAQGAAMLVSLSDDSWIDSAAYRAQMLGTARLRAMEFGKPLLRVTNGNRSVLIDAQGREQAGAAGLGAETLALTATPRDGSTPYQRIAPEIAAAPVLVWCAALLLAFGPATRRSRRLLNRSP